MGKVIKKIFFFLFFKPSIKIADKICRKERGGGGGIKIKKKRNKKKHQSHVTGGVS